ncbi:hypothetical protein TWF730_009387 [Orbilia blumenaviensis]|uniref:Uncharacterized protein n=1 Tax=Orbilia blumenaviensis TaxID=1796055 RepID=A0AAV9UYF0_9PEZI
MNILLLSLFALPPVLGDCARFITSDGWDAKLSGSPGTEWLFDSPPAQVSNYTTCTEDFRAVNEGTERRCFDNSAQCKLIAEGGVSASARFSVPPINNNTKSLEAFFNVVAAAVMVNQKKSGFIDPVSANYQICGSIRNEYGEVGTGTPGYCLEIGSTAWIGYEPRYRCVNGTAQDCKNGPYESGQNVVVCGVADLPDGSLSLVENRTIGEGARRYTATDANPAIPREWTCDYESVGVTGFEVKPSYFGLIGLAMIIPFVL